jgi:uncharacterized metal-binding protein
MPGRSAHAAATVATALVLTAAAPLLAGNADLSALDALGAPAGALLGLALHPDLDLAENRLSPWSWRVLWLPYGILVAHRSVISHFPVLSTVLRLAYIAVPLVVLGLALGFDSLGALAWLWGWHVLRWAVLGLAVSDLLHVVMDLL